MKSLFFVPLFLFTFAGCLAQQPSNLQSLDAKYKAKGKKYFGVCADKGTLGNPKNADIVSKVFGQVTPENSMKWDSIEWRQGNFNFSKSDYLVDWAQKNSKIIRGHTLLWHSQLPQWVGQINSAAEIKAVLEKHVTAEVTRYKGKIYAWDVANEILDEGGNFRASPWNKKEKGIDMEEMVKIAFQAAKKADPAAKLYINDYNLDSASARKTQAMVTKVKQWRSQGIPIDGIGTQAHLKPKQAGGAKAALQALCAAAPECAVTELDIEGANPEEYATVVKACLEVKNCVGVTIWGISDKESWRAGTKPLLFDAEWKEKGAFKAIVQAIS